MNLPPSFLDELRGRLSLAQVVGRKVSWDPRKTNQGKGDYWAACPFHQEKSASFHVDDRKGYYYCFGCHAKGDAIGFVKETENVSFMEAVEILAREAGMPMPARDPAAQAKADRRGQLAEVMEQAVRHYRLQLKTGAAGPARDYLAGRGLKEAALDRFEIGFAPEGWQGLWEHLRGRGVAEDLIFGAGLAKPSTKGGKPYDVFRNRIMFPIRDARGRAIAFGGRAMDPDDPAKYLNSPETDLFDKGRTLFNHGPAREASGKGRQLVVAEGYMDVIALVMAGFEAAVAPLGTAVTEEQLALLWRLHPEPVVALDGDKAGLNAALRLMDLALPLIEAGQSLRFALMPPPKDPDDVIREGGRAAMQAILDRAEPMVTLLWRRETEGKVFDSPERRATLDRRLRAVLGRIRDPSLRGHYGEEIRRLRYDLFGSGRPPPPRPKDWSPRGTGWRAAQAEPLAATRASPLAAASGTDVEEGLHEAVILAALIVHRRLLAEFEGALEGLACSGPAHETLRQRLLSGEDIPSDTLETLGPAGHLRIVPALRPQADPDIVRLCLAEEFARLAAVRGARREIADAMDDLEGFADEGLTWRLRQAAEATTAIGRGQTEDRAEYDVAPNGARLNREEKAAFDRLLSRIGAVALPPPEGEPSGDSARDTVEDSKN